MATVPKDPTQLAVKKIQPPPALFEHDGAIWKMVPIQNEEGDTQFQRQKVLDCTLNVVGIHEIEKDNIIELEIKKGKEPPKTAMLDAYALEKCDLLNAWGTKKAVCDWNLSHPDRLALKHYILSQPGAQHVVNRPGYGGYVKEHGVFLGQDHCIDSDGLPVTVVNGRTPPMACKDGIKREFCLPDMVLPHFALDDLLEIMPSSRLFIKDCHTRSITAFRFLATLMREALGHDGGAIAIGWLVANLFQSEVFADRHAFPLAYLYGKTGSGKDTLGGWLNTICCLQHSTPTKAGKGTSHAFIRAGGAAIGGFPMYINELRNNDACRDLMDTLRSAFDGQTGGISNKAHEQVTFPMRRGVLLSGQDILGSDAEYSRYVLVRMLNRILKTDRFDLVSQTCRKTRPFFLLLCSMRSTFASEFMPTVRQWELALHNAVPTVSARQRFCWAVALTGMNVAFNAMEEYGLPDKLPQFLDGRPVWEEILGRISGAAYVAQEDSALSTFWSQLEVLRAENKLGNTGDQKWCQAFTHRIEGREMDAIAIWLAMPLQKIAQLNKSPPSHRLLITELEDSDGYLGGGFSLKMRDVYKDQVGNWKTIGHQRSCLVFWADTPILPQWIKDLAIQGRVAPEDPDVGELGGIAVPAPAPTTTVNQKELF